MILHSVALHGPDVNAWPVHPRVIAIVVTTCKTSSEDRIYENAQYLTFDEHDVEIRGCISKTTCYDTSGRAPADDICQQVGSLVMIYGHTRRR